MQPENFNQETPQVEQSSSLHKVTPLSKYLAIVLFIILPFLGGYIGYQYAPEKVVEVERVVIQESDEMSENESKNKTEDIVASAESITFPNSQELSLELPAGWDYIQPNVYDNDDKIVFSLSYPIREVGYEPLYAANVREITTPNGFELRVVDRVERDDRTIGFAHYMHGVQRDWGGDFFRDSFEIMVRYNNRGHYVSTDMQPGEYVKTRYKTYQEYLTEEDFIQGIIEGIDRNTMEVQQQQLIQDSSNRELYVSPNGFSVLLPEGIAVEEQSAQFSYSPITRVEGDFGSLCISSGYGCGGVGMQGWMSSNRVLTTADGLEMDLNVWTRGDEVFMHLDSILNPVPKGFSEDAQIQLRTTADQLEVGESILTSISFTE